MEVDTEDDGEDRGGSSADRYFGIRQYRRASSVPNGFLSAGQPEADRHQLQSVPGSAIPAYFLVAGALPAGTIYLLTLVSPISMRSLRSSPSMRGAPESGL